jgi:hypothetical protein
MIELWATSGHRSASTARLVRIVLKDHTNVGALGITTEGVKVPLGPVCTLRVAGCETRVV